MFLIIILSMAILMLIVFTILLFKFYKSEDDINLINIDDKNKYILYIYGNYNVSKYDMSPLYIKYFGLNEIIKSYINIFKYTFKNDKIIKIEICECEECNNEKVIRTIYYD